MTDLFFTDQINRITGCFNEQYRGEKFTLIKDYVKELEDDEFSLIVTDFISNCKFAPLPIDFKNRALDALKRRKAKSKEVKAEERTPDPKCKLCGDSGMIRANSKMENYKVWFHCFCEWGVKKNEIQFFNLPILDDDYKILFEITEWDECFKINQDKEAFANIVREFSRSVRRSEEFFKTGKIPVDY